MLTLFGRLLKLKIIVKSMEFMKSVGEIKGGFYDNFIRPHG
jgi:hypothetical protein